MVDRGHQLIQDVLEQQRDVLTKHDPSAGKALAAYEAAIKAAADREAEALGAAQHAVNRAILAASDLQLQTELDAIRAQQEAVETATRKRDAALAEAERIFDEIVHALDTQTHKGKSIAVEAARAKRDASIREADRALRKAEEDAQRTSEKDAATSREVQHQSVARAQAIQAQAEVAAATEHDRDVQNAERALATALSKDPTAAAIRQAFLLRLAEVARETEDAKADVFARMVLDLKTAT